MSDYYTREATVHLDGSPIFQNESDRQNESSVANEIARAWNCNIKSFGMLSSIDWFAERHGRLIGVLELKSRTHSRGEYPSVFLSVKKWLALSLASVGLGCPAIFVVRFTDGIYWAPLSGIDASDNRIAGCARIVKSSSDIEPIIDVPIELLKPLKGSAA